MRESLEESMALKVEEEKPKAKLELNAESQLFWQKLVQ